MAVYNAREAMLRWIAAFFGLLAEFRFRKFIANLFSPPSIQYYIISAHLSSLLGKCARSMNFPCPRWDVLLPALALTVLRR